MIARLCRPIYDSYPLSKYPSTDDNDAWVYDSFNLLPTNLLQKLNVPYLQCIYRPDAEHQRYWLLNKTYIEMHANKLISVNLLYFWLILYSVLIFEYGSCFKWRLQVGNDSSVSDCSHRYCYHCSTRLVHRLQQRSVYCSHWHSGLIIITTNVWQSLAYSPYDVVVSPPGEYLWNISNYWSPQCLTTPPLSERTWTNRHKIFYANHTTSYVLNSGSMN